MKTPLKMIFFAHRKRFVGYFNKLSNQHAEDLVVTVWQVLKYVGFFHKPPTDLAKEIIQYELDKHFYKPGQYQSTFYRFFLKTFHYLKLFFFYSAATKFLRKYPTEFIVIWGAGGFYQKIFAAIARQNQITVLIMENGFLPNTTVVDAKGVNAECSLPREKRFYLQLDSKSLPEELPEKLVVRESKKLDLAISTQEPEVSIAHTQIRPYVFIPFQCNRDSVIIWHSPKVKNMWEFFDYVVEYAAEFPEIDFVIKEHPSCPEDYSGLYAKIKTTAIKNIIFKNTDSTENLIKNALAVMTINSSVGFESLLFGKSVITLGNAAYNIDGLVLPGSRRDFAKAHIRSVINGWKPDAEVLNKFLRYVYHGYLIQGTRKEVSRSHIDAFHHRVKEISESRKEP